MKKVKSLALKVGHALASREARGPEVALARVILGALGLKLGYDFSRFLG